MENQRPQFDEQAALQALEHLRDQIRSARSRREEKVAEFEAFVRSNRAASQAERLAALNEREGALAVQGAARTADRAADPLLPQMMPDPRPRLEPPVRTQFEAFQDEPRFQRSGAAGLSIWRDRRVHIALGVVALVLLTLLWAPWRDNAPETQAGAAPETVPAPAQGAPAPGPVATSTADAAAPATAPPAAASRPLQVELTTIGPVWMRVVVDGERRVERQVPAGQKLTFGADRAIVLRAGDAGSVRVAVDGVDQGVLGRVGQVVNRTFTPRPR